MKKIGLNTRIPMRLNIFRIFKRVAAILDGTFALNQSLIHQAVKILLCR